MRLCAQVVCPPYSQKNPHSFFDLCCPLSMWQCFQDEQTLQMWLNGHTHRQPNYSNFAARARRGLIQLTITGFSSRSLLAVFTALTSPTFTDLVCPYCNTPISKDQHFAEHLAQSHLSRRLTDIIDLLIEEDEAIFSVVTELKRLRSNLKVFQMRLVALFNQSFPPPPPYMSLF